MAPRPRATLAAVVDAEILPWVRVPRLWRARLFHLECEAPQLARGLLLEAPGSERGTRVFFARSATLGGRRASLFARSAELGGRHASLSARSAELEGWRASLPARSAELESVAPEAFCLERRARRVERESRLLGAPSRGRGARGFIPGAPSSERGRARHLPRAPDALPRRPGFEAGRRRTRARFACPGYACCPLNVRRCRYRAPRP